MIQFSARSDCNNPDYTSPEVQHLAIGCIALKGDGSADSPLLHEVTIRNEGETTWNGIIRLDLPLDAVSPRFFMPGFLTYSEDLFPLPPVKIDTSGTSSKSSPFIIGK